MQRIFPLHMLRRSSRGLMVLFVVMPGITVPLVHVAANSLVAAMDEHSTYT